MKRPLARRRCRPAAARRRGAARERPALPVGLPARGVQGALGGGLRQDRRRGRRRRAGRAADERLPAAAPDELDLLPLGHRDAARLPAARRPHRKVTLYLPPRNERLERSEGKVLSAADAELVKRLTGADEVLSTEAMDARWPLGEGAPGAIYAESVPAEGYAESRYELQAPGRRDRQRLLGRPRSRASGASSSCCAPATRAPTIRDLTPDPGRAARRSRARARSRSSVARRSSPGSA